MRILTGLVIGPLVLTACSDKNTKPVVLDDAGGRDETTFNATTQTAHGSHADASTNDASLDSESQSDAARTDAGQTDDEGTTNVAADAGSAAPTFYSDILPLIEKSCLGCHMDGGIGPMRLDTYADVKSHAEAIQFVTENRIMPPYLVQNDDSCGDFANAPYLTDDELATIRAWVAAGSLEGSPRAVQVPTPGELEAATEVDTPTFSPVPGGGVLDEHDDYRCFLLDPPALGAFITGYQVVPGNTAIVHHVVVNLVDMEGASSLTGDDASVLTNAQAIAAHDAADPDVEGWKCFGLAGDGIEVDSVPVVWAPGQGVVRYPNDAGIPIAPSHKLVVQVHYNLANEAHHGESDQTKIKFELKEPGEVANVGLYIPNDPLLDSLLSGGDPEILPPGEASTKFVWESSFADLGLAGIPQFQLWGLFPHMHEAGKKYTVELAHADSGEYECAAKINSWDFHWQHLYFYSEATIVTPTDSIRVTCDYDTRSKTSPILPGWGTQNEMCFLGIFVTIPNQ